MKFGYPAYSTFISWVHADKRFKKNIVYTPNTRVYNSDIKKKAVIDSSLNHKTLSGVANEYGVSRTTIYNWREDLTGDTILKNENKSKSTKKELLTQIEQLKEEQFRLQLENDILKKANEIIKKEIGASYNKLTNKEKTLIISALKSKYKVSELLNVLLLKKSTYYYEASIINYDKYNEIRGIIKNIFYDNYNCYGYRRIKIALLRDYGINISEKVIIRIMKEEKLCVYVPKSMKNTLHIREK